MYCLELVLINFIVAVCVVWRENGGVIMGESVGLAARTILGTPFGCLPNISAP